MSRKFRHHQRLTDAITRAIADGTTDVHDVLAAVTPGGGKSLLPVIAAARLMAAGVVDRVCWIVPRDSLRRQAEEAFADAGWRQHLRHSIDVRAAENAPDPCRGTRGYVTTYQAVAAAPDLHLSEFRRHRYLLAIDEMHHLPGLADTDPMAGADGEAAWSAAILPLLETARIRLVMSGTLERSDGRSILWLPYRSPQRTAGGRKIRRIDFDAPGWAIVGYSRRQALAEGAILPVTFGAVDGEAEWRLKHAPESSGPKRISGDPVDARMALYTAFRTGFAGDLLNEAFGACRKHRAERRREIGAPPGEEVRGLGKLLVVAADQKLARLYLEHLQRRFPPESAQRAVRLAVSDISDAQEAIAAFRLRGEPSILVTVAMAYEGMDCPEVSHVACLTHIRSRPWLEQLIARAVRVDPHGGSYERQRAVVYHPDDFMFRRFRIGIETEQGTRARIKRPQQGALAFNDGAEDGYDPGIEPLRSNATALRFDVVAPGPDFGAGREAREEPPPDGVLPFVMETPSTAERRLRQRIGQMVAAQVIEDEDAHLHDFDRAPGYHAYNAVLKRVMGKARGEMSLEELEATVGWLDRNRIADHLHLIEDDHRYQWTATRRDPAFRRGRVARRA